GVPLRNEIRLSRKPQPVPFRVRKHRRQRIIRWQHRGIRCRRCVFGCGGILLRAHIRPATHPHQTSSQQFWRKPHPAPDDVLAYAAIAHGCRASSLRISPPSLSRTYSGASPVTSPTPAACPSVLAPRANSPSYARISRSIQIATSLPPSPCPVLIHWQYKEDALGALFFL